MHDHNCHVPSAACQMEKSTGCCWGLPNAPRSGLSATVHQSPTMRGLSGVVDFASGVADDVAGFALREVTGGEGPAGGVPVVFGIRAPGSRRRIHIPGRIPFQERLAVLPLQRQPEVGRAATWRRESFAATGPRGTMSQYRTPVQTWKELEEPLTSKIRAPVLGLVGIRRGRVGWHHLPLCPRPGDVLGHAVAGGTVIPAVQTRSKRPVLLMAS